jgi:hypothetical protein
MRRTVLAVLIQAAGAATPAVIPEIVVSPSVGSGTRETMQALAQPRPKPGFTFRARLQGPTLLEFSRPAEIARIVVDLYDPGATPWGDTRPWTPESLERHVAAMLLTPLGEASPFIDWSENNLWSAAATLTFSDDRQGRLVFDGLHGCYQDPDGYRWFFRYAVNRP